MNRSLLAGVTAAAVLAGAGVAPAQTGESYDVAFSPAKPNRSASFALSGAFDGQKVIDQLQFQLPQGARFDTSAVEQCNASRQQLIDEGPANACSENSEIGEGEAVALVGGTRVEIPIRIYNRRSAMIVAFQVGDAGFHSISPIRGRSITIGLAQAASIDARPLEFTLAVGRTARGEDPYLRTPRSCPSTRRWRSALKYRAQGTTTTLSTTVRCSKR